jgi:hypothetical protein
MNTYQRIDLLVESDEMFTEMAEAVFGDDIFVRTDNTVLRGGFAYGERHIDGFVNVMAVAS